MKRIAVMLGSLAFLGAALVVVLSPVLVETQGGRNPNEIPSPDHWVSFSALISKTGGGSVAVGRFFRGTDGSERRETGPTLDDIRVITIHNMTTERFYRFLAGKGWTEQPMQLSPMVKRPRKMLRTMQGLSRGQQTTLLRAGRGESVASYQSRAQRGDVLMIVPALNFFTVDQIMPDGGRLLFHDIDIVDVDPGLFLPPAGSLITTLTEPGGIIVSSVPAGK